MIAMYFPPAGGVGVFRVTKYVKYLSEYGWEPIVVTASEDTYARYDYRLLDNIKNGTKIYRLPLFKMKFINDMGFRFLFSLIKNIGKIISEEKPDVIYLTGGPFTYLIAGWIIKKIYKTPYVIDLRDPWKLERRNLKDKRIKAILMRSFENIFEPITLKNAECVMCATSYMTEEYKAEYKDRIRFITITNGYDEDDFKDIQPYTNDRFTILYTGKFKTYANFRNPYILFRAIKEINKNEIKVNFVHVGEPEKVVIDMASDLGILDVCEFVGEKSYHETLEYSKGADLLVVIGGGQKNEQTGKIFDYLGCGNDILVIAREDGGIAEISKETDKCYLVSPEDQGDIMKTIMDVYKNNIEEKEQVSTLRNNKYTRKNLTRSLAIELDYALLTNK